MKLLHNSGVAAPRAHEARTERGDHEIGSGRRRRISKITRRAVFEDDGDDSDDSAHPAILARSHEPPPSRYTILGEIARGGMGCVCLGRMTGSAGFSRLVAIKRLHPQLALESLFVAMLVDEARLAGQIRHTNVVNTLDLVASDGAFNLVLEYVEGESLGTLIRNAHNLNEPIPPPIALAIIYGVLRGLDAAHEARSEEGQPLGIVHRDVSPHNVLVGVDGIPRLIDFGVAKALGRIVSTQPGELRGKISYMAPEQLLSRPVTRQVDVYAAGVLLWELLAGEKLFAGEDQRAIGASVLRDEIPNPSFVNPRSPAPLDPIVLQATSRELSDRFMTCREFLTALEDCALERATDDEVGAWVRRLSATSLAARQRLVQSQTLPADGGSIEDWMVDLSRSVVVANDATTTEPFVPSVRAGVGVSETRSPVVAVFAKYSAFVLPTNWRALAIVLAPLAVFVVLASSVRFLRAKSAHAALHSASLTTTMTMKTSNVPMTVPPVLQRASSPPQPPVVDWMTTPGASPSPTVPGPGPGVSPTTTTDHPKKAFRKAHPPLHADPHVDPRSYR